jgi:hypothetical protein
MPPPTSEDEIASLIQERILSRLDALISRGLTADSKGYELVCAAVEQEIDEYKREAGVATEHRVGCVRSPGNRHGLAVRVFSVEKRYRHDCDECSFIGHLGDGDFYVCSKQGWRTFIVRMGNEGADYFSTPEFVLEKSPNNAPFLEDLLCARDVSTRLLSQSS